MSAKTQFIDRNVVIAFLSLLGYQDNDEVFLRFFYPSGDPRKKSDKGRKLNAKFPNLPWEQMEQLQSAGYGCYVVVNGGGHRDSEVILGRAIFYEHDNLDKVVSRDLWKTLNLPEPTCQGDTGGKSIHTYLRLSNCTIDQWTNLQLDLLEFADADRSNKNPSRVMRLIGATYLAPGREPVQSELISCSNKVYTYEELRAAIPRRNELAIKRQWSEFDRQFKLPTTKRVPLIECLSRANRVLIEQGTGEGQRNDRGYALACDLIGVSNYLSKIAQPYEGEPKLLFEQYCSLCSPPLEVAEAESIWRSAEVRSTGSSLSESQIENCIKGWEWRQRSQETPSEIYKSHSEVNYKVPEQTKAEPTEDLPNFEDTMQQLDLIFEVFGVGTARWKWEIGVLAKAVKRSRSELLEIYQDKQSETEPFAPVDVTDFLSSDQPEREWLIAGHVSLASTIGLIADGGVGKTLLVYDLCKAIATGNSWNGFRSKRSKVLIIQTDEPEVDTRERLNIAGFQALEAGWIFIETNWQFCKIRQLEDWIEQHFASESGFVVIDSMSSANRSTQAEEKDSSYAAPLYSLRDIANRRNVTFVILHHTNKMGGARGTTAFRNNLSEVWVLRKGDPKDNLKPTQRILEIEKSRSGCNGIFQIELNVDDYSWDYQGDFGLDENTPVPLKARILSWLEQNRGTKYEAEELLEVSTVGAGSTKEAIRKQLERLKRQGLVDCEDRTRQSQAGTRRYKVYFLPAAPVASGQSPDSPTLEACPEASANHSYPDAASLRPSGQASGQLASGQLQCELTELTLPFASGEYAEDDWTEIENAAAPNPEENGRDLAIGDKVLAYHSEHWEEAVVLKIPINASNGKSIRCWKVRLANGNEVHIWERRNLAPPHHIPDQSEL
ncbi:AAA family ATPase [Leptolyngbya sp. NIES-2104]|uniref:AAA family ATPase n=1 Tax=Leptolyngbya sp. NIES-2104 TaxID=1552121 RepID=UPI0006EC9562|nr:AAA family ATPase [Leptolyngbya sp. NIES-2104]GAP99101.1 hypothetical protein NIES2104_56580 [Leptolyngbya sp. NIES-2104]